MVMLPAPGIVLGTDEVLSGAWGLDCIAKGETHMLECGFLFPTVLYPHFLS